MMPANYNADNICPHSGDDKLPDLVRSDDGQGGTSSVGFNSDCLSTIWESLNATNAAAGGTSSLLTKETCSDKWDNESTWLPTI